MVSCRVVVRSKEKWMQRMNEKSNKREEDKLVNIKFIVFKMWLHHCFASPFVSKRHISFETVLIGEAKLL
jgi:hypothetical protein